MEVNDMNVFDNAQVKSALQTLNQNEKKIYPTSDMVNMKSMKKRVRGLVETDDDLYGVV